MKLKTEIKSDSVVYTKEAYSIGSRALQKQFMKSTESLHPYTCPSSSGFDWCFTTLFYLHFC